MANHILSYQFIVPSGRKGGLSHMFVLIIMLTVTTMIAGGMTLNLYLYTRGVLKHKRLI
jgi:hypothetical protein